jgi:hypothetical protein
MKIRFTKPERKRFVENVERTSAHLKTHERFFFMKQDDIAPGRTFLMRNGRVRTVTSVDSSRFHKSDWIVYWRDVDTGRAGDMLLKAFSGQSVKVIEV